MKKFTVKPRFTTSQNIALVGDPKDHGHAWLYLGRLAEVGPLTDVRFDASYAHVVAIFGKRGSGNA